MVNAQKAALCRLWTDVCTVTKRVKRTDGATGLTDWTEEVLYSDVPCRLSFENYGRAMRDRAAVGDPAAAVAQHVKLFLDPALSIPAGCCISVLRGDRVFHYRGSGQPAVFHSHQEINLELFDKWA